MPVMRETPRHHPEPRARRGEAGAALVISMLLIVLLAGMGMTMLTLSDTDNLIAKNDELSEGAFYAAEAATQLAIQQIGPNKSSSVTAIAEADLGADFSYRSGSREDDAAQPITFVGSIPKAGYTISANTAYNTTGYVFDVYRINATGRGPRGAEREVEVRVEYGPTPQ